MSQVDSLWKFFSLAQVCGIHTAILIFIEMLLHYLAEIKIWVAFEKKRNTSNAPNAGSSVMTIVLYSVWNE